MFLGKYKNVKKLGKGAYGEVFLVENQKKQLYALKMMSKKKLDEEDMNEYLEGEKDCMMSVKNEYIVRLYDFEEDETHKYFVEEYCDGGDLFNYQAKQPGHLYELKKATMILSEVIKGLELLHKIGYLHRDIKPQNILLKKTDKPDQYKYKLADFGFSKKIEDAEGTVCGTEAYMSPQILSGEIYSFEVDMWAFGVLLYYMLNMQYPFKLNPHCKDNEQKRQHLLKQAKNFIYSEAVKNTKKKNTKTCSKQMDDLFSRIFTVKPEQRIDFSDIRGHPIFREYFSSISQQSKILYKGKKMLNKYDSYRLSRKQTKQLKKDRDDGMPKFLDDIDKQKKFQRESKFIVIEYNKIRFLREVEEEAANAAPALSNQEILMLRYCCMKYHIMLLRKFMSELTVKSLQKKVQLKWKEFLSADLFKKQLKTWQEDLSHSELKLQQIYNGCGDRIKQIFTINPDFKKIYEKSVTQKEFDGDFKEAYRCATGIAYSKLRKTFSDGHKYVYLTAIVTIAHGLNNLILENDRELEEIFIHYINKQKLKGEKVDFSCSEDLDGQERQRGFETHYLIDLKPLFYLIKCLMS